MSVSLPSFDAQGHPLLTWRLELLERLLLGVVPRERRLEIVAQTERRMDELLAELKEPQPTEEQLLQILARLDSPEAVLTSAGASLQMGPSNLAPSFGHWAAAQPPRRPASRRSLVAAGLGATSVGLVVLTPLFYYLLVLVAEFISPAIVSEDVLAYCCLGGYLGLLLLTSAGGCSTSLAALWQLRRRQGTHTGYVWATLGLIASAGPLLLSALISVWCVSLLWPASATGTATATGASMGTMPSPAPPQQSPSSSSAVVPYGASETIQPASYETETTTLSPQTADVVLPAEYKSQAASQNPDAQIRESLAEERPDEVPLPRD